MKKPRDKYQCDLCHRVYGITGVILIAPGDPIEHLCHECVKEGWLSYCSSCWHTFPHSMIDKYGDCPECQVINKGKTLDIW